jgi:hypothetical protein
MATRLRASYRTFLSSTPPGTPDVHLRKGLPGQVAAHGSESTLMLNVGLMG